MPLTEGRHTNNLAASCVNVMHSYKPALATATRPAGHTTMSMTSVAPLCATRLPSSMRLRTARQSYVAPLTCSRARRGSSAVRLAKSGVPATGPEDSASSSSAVAPSSTAGSAGSLFCAMLATRRRGVHARSRGSADSELPSRCSASSAGSAATGGGRLVRPHDDMLSEVRAVRRDSSAGTASAVVPSSVLCDRSSSRRDASGATRHASTRRSPHAARLSVASPHAPPAGSGSGSDPRLFTATRPPGVCTTDCGVTVHARSLSDLTLGAAASVTSACALMWHSWKDTADRRVAALLLPLVPDAPVLTGSACLGGGTAGPKGAGRPSTHRLDSVSASRLGGSGPSLAGCGYAARSGLKRSDLSAGSMHR
mmetsp:Transcript_8685/g.21508  ORF Transcript_8685/g.21508 Transcript_8685/m.21508 type:complete len:368 (-) Transcript_8685:853-1956(-)